MSIDTFSGPDEPVQWDSDGNEIPMPWTHQATRQEELEQLIAELATPSNAASALQFYRLKAELIKLQN